MITEVLAPVPVAAVLIVAVALRSAGTPAEGLGWAVLAVFLVCAIPFAFVLLQVRRRRYTDHHVQRREQRPLPLLVALAAIVAGFLVLVRLGAPHDLVALLLAMVVGGIVCLLITLVWKISIHTGTVAATVLILALVFGPVLLVLEICAGLVAWARVEVGAHSVAQVIGGGIIGALVTPTIFLLLR